MEIERKTMNFGTKVRTILAVIMLINEALIRIGTVDFGDDTSNLIYRWVSFIFLVLAYIASHWYNNDFTPIASEYTGAMRQAKEGDEAGVDVSGLDYLEDGDDDEEL